MVLRGGRPAAALAPSAFFGRREWVPLPLGASSPPAGGFWPSLRAHFGGRPPFFGRWPSSLAGRPRFLGGPPPRGASSSSSSPRSSAFSGLEARDLLAEAVLLGLGGGQARGDAVGHGQGLAGVVLALVHA